MEENKSLFNRIKNKFTKKTAIALVAIVVVGALVVPRILSFVMMRGQGGANPFENVGTRTTTLTKQVLNDSVSVTGTVQSTQTVNVTCTLTGYTVSEILVQEGDKVTEGDVIARLDTGDLLEKIQETKDKLAKNAESAQTAYTEAEDAAAKVYNQCIDQEAVLAAAIQAEKDAEYNFTLAKNAVAAQQADYDAAQQKTIVANNTNNQFLTLLNNAISEYSAASSAVKQAEEDVSTAQIEYDKAVSEGSENAESLKNSLELAQRALTAAQTRYTQADSNLEKARAEQSATQQEYDQAKSNEARALAALNTVKEKANYTVLESVYTSAQKNRSTARSTLDSLQNTYKNALSAFEKAEESLENANTSDELEELYEKYNNCTITANASGTITQVNTQVGSVASGTIAVIQDTENLKIATSFREYDVQNLEIGMECIITSDANDKQMTGYVSQISPVASSGGMGASSDVSFAGEITINGTDHGLLIGMNAAAEIIITQVSDAYVVPYDAVGTDENGEKVVYVKNGEEFTPVVVQTGMETDYYIEITSPNLMEGMVIRSSANEDESNSVVFTEDGETTENSGFNMGMLGGASGGMPSGGDRPSGGGMPGGSMPGGRG